jgi:hypothetical protein
VDSAVAAAGPTRRRRCGPGGGGGGRGGDGVDSVTSKKAWKILAV